MNELRQKKIEEFVQDKEVVTIKQLQSMFPDVSLMTIHRDLDALAAAGKLTKIRGGARTISHSSDLIYSIRERENTKEKNIIAQKAIKLIQPGSSVFIDAGTTSIALASLLPDIFLSVFTTGPNIALKLIHLTKPSVNLLGGNLNKDNLALSGYSTLEALENINIDLAFIGVSGCSAEDGFTCGKESEMLVKKHVIKKARTTAVLCDHSKLTRLMPFTFAHIKDVDYIISEKDLPQSFADKAEEGQSIIL